MSDAQSPVEYDPDAHYRVRLTRPVTVIGVRLLPLDAHVMRGDFLSLVIAEAGADVVDSAERL